MNNNGLDIFKKTASLLARNATTLFVLGSLSLLSACGGGGGSNGVGLDGVDNTIGGTGGPGTPNSITGTPVYYAGGGSGIIQSSRGNGITGNPAALGLSLIHI